MLPKEPYQKVLVIACYIGLSIGAFYLFFNYLFGPLLPFIIAFLVSLMLRPAVNFCERNSSRVPRKLIALVLVLLVTFLLGCGIYFGIRRLYIELNSLGVSIEEFYNKLKDDKDFANGIINTINDYIPFFDISDKLHEIIGELDSNLLQLVLGIINGTSSQMLSFVTSAVSVVPTAILSVVITIISTYYFTVDYGIMKKAFISMFSPATAEKLRTVKHRFQETIGKYLRAYGLICSITFVELLVALSILNAISGVKYVFLIALVTAILDILPVLGTGTVLLPWAVFSLITKNYYLGIGLFITYVVITIIREIIEPKIVGKYIGLHPLLTLASMYLGIRLLGFVGLFLFPIIAILVTKLNAEGVIHLYKVPEGSEQMPHRKFVGRRVPMIIKTKSKKKQNKDDDTKGNS